MQPDIETPAPDEDKTEQAEVSLEEVSNSENQESEASIEDSEASNS